MVRASRKFSLSTPCPRFSITLKRAGWVEPFAKPIIFANPQLMGIASHHPSYELGLYGGQ